jgi:segregation and condensation protein B
MSEADELQEPAQTQPTEDGALETEASGANTPEEDAQTAEAADEAVEAATADEAERTEEDRAQLKLVIEALLFSTDRPVNASRLAEAAEARDGREARSIVLELRDDYDAQGRAFAVEEIAGGYQILSRPEYGPYIARMQSRQRQDNLSKAALETLAIVAYRQPITRAALEDIRGVGCGSMLRQLVDRRLLRVVGRADELGRPMLYGTTRQFLEAFGLKSLEDLPRRGQLAMPEEAREEEERTDKEPTESEQDAPAAPENEQADEETPSED